MLHFPFPLPHYTTSIPIFRGFPCESGKREFSILGWWRPSLLLICVGDKGRWELTRQRNSWRWNQLDGHVETFRRNRSRYQLWLLYFPIFIALQRSLPCGHLSKTEPTVAEDTPLIRFKVVCIPCKALYKCSAFTPDLDHGTFWHCR